MTLSRGERLCAVDMPDKKTLEKEDLTVLIDVTEQAIERPAKKQKQYYSDKKNSPRSKSS